MTVGELTIVDFRELTPGNYEVKVGGQWIPSTDLVNLVDPTKIDGLVKIDDERVRNGRTEVLVANIWHDYLTITNILTAGGGGGGGGDPITVKEVDLGAGGNYTIGVADVDTAIKFTGNGTITFPNDTTTAFAVGRTVTLIKDPAAGVITVQNEGGATLETNGATTLNHMASFLKFAANTWYGSGTLS